MIVKEGREEGKRARTGDAEKGKAVILRTFISPTLRLALHGKWLVFPFLLPCPSLGGDSRGASHLSVSGTLVFQGVRIASKIANYVPSAESARSANQNAESLRPPMITIIKGMTSGMGLPPRAPDGATPIPRRANTGIE